MYFTLSKQSHFMVIYIYSIYIILFKHSQLNENYIYNTCIISSTIKIYNTLLHLFKKITGYT